MSGHLIWSHEDDGTLARLHCSCGWKSGLYPRAMASEMADEHYRSTRPLRRLLAALRPR